ncbi:MAG: GTPase HflX [Melioribacteraceae bacterium]|nr:MAG: GTPase HflX [Melioribacteraceae bacterium]
MGESNIKMPEKAILVAINPGRETLDRIEEYLDELEMLADTAGAQTVFKIIQQNERKNPAFYVGKGKAEEIKELAEMNDVNLIIFDDDLTPTQVRNLEKLTEKKILDRSGLILDIFAAHARTNEAKTQVELAQLQYMLPRLTRAWTHLSKQYGGIGTKGPGETQIETDRRLIRTRIAKLKEKLKKIESQSQTRTLGRKGFVTASLVGYTNAGKSTILNLLTEADVLAENKLFATLDSTTRALELDKGKKMLLSDTVGFIRKLPHNLVASFRTTLNVVRDADIIIHVVDVSHPYFEDHIRVVEETLLGLKCDKIKTILVFNKIDALENKEKMEYVKNKFPDSILISAVKGFNISKLIEKLTEIWEDGFIEEQISLHINRTKTVAQIYELAEVLEKRYEEDRVLITFRADKANANKIERIVNES